MKFRKDINGLRAFAVIAVVLFHFNASWMPGGFAGVDVFFVISGFLMTGIIFKGLENNNFSILNFYVARANRIVPALAALCLVLLIFGWFYLTPLEYRALAKHAASSIGFISNLVYWKEAGYFDAASHEKWLLHTWSLSVEWQFYIIYPLVLLLLKRLFSFSALKYFIFAGTILGFIFSVYATYKWPNASYYFFPMRAWEMMLGGIAYIYPFRFNSTNKKLVEILGLFLILGSYIFITGNAAWPGYLALLPVLGTFLIIQAQRNESFIMDNVVSQKLGAWSYSIYLWHWPFVVAINIFKLPSQFIYIGMLLSVLLGYLSYRYIERIKFNRNFPTLFSYLKSKPIYIAALIGIISSFLFLYQFQITPLRFSGEKLLIAQQSTKNQGNCINDIDGCKYGEGEIKAILVGDSHALSNVIAISERAKLYNGSILSFGKGNCPTIKEHSAIKTSNPKYECSYVVENALKVAKNKYPNVPVIIINRGFSDNFPIYESVGKVQFKDDMVKTFCDFSKTNPVFLVRPTPEYDLNVPREMLNSLLFNNNLKHIKLPRREHDLLKREFNQVQDLALNQCHNIRLIDPTPLFCDTNYCYADKKGSPLYFDEDHLSGYGSQRISKVFDEVFR